MFITWCINANSKWYSKYLKIRIINEIINKKIRWIRKE